MIDTTGILIDMVFFCGLVIGMTIFAILIGNEIKSAKDEILKAIKKERG